MAKIVIIEDDAALASELKKLLLESGYEVQIIGDFTDVANQVIQSSASLALLDINIPGINGERVLKQIRETSAMPIIMLTSRNSEADEIISMSYGADDFIAKPFVPQILLLRIEAVLSRTLNHNGPKPLTYKDILVNPLRSSITFRNAETVLSKNEFVILTFLIKHAGKIVSRAEIMDSLWDDDQFVDDNTLTVNINRLRRRLEDAGLKDFIKTRRAQGYILE